ncbi:uncharacterized protein LOC116119508 [Pistacia vera]|uniref:uncharacterized protein LOC116119508 n=1 Tax=Pistacia vera TaxID=55513 RepID=UPI001262EDC4|nr:uncharacterized protein LOC116119508 [Pistacia vera]
MGVVDNGSATNIIFLEAFRGMRFTERDLKACPLPLYGFTDDSLVPKGMIDLPVTLGAEPKIRMVMAEFLVDTIDPRIHREKPTAGPTEELREICVSEEDPTRIQKVGSNLSKDMADNLAGFLKKNLDVFAWVHADMVGISPKVMCHKLNIDSKARPIRHKRRSIDVECSKALKDEIDKLLNINFIREVKYPDWLSNPVLVKKSNGKWQTCVDFTDLNKVCPKDNFPLPQIDQLVDATI